MENTMLCNIREKLVLLALWWCSFLELIKLSRDLSIVQFIFIIAFYLTLDCCYEQYNMHLESKMVPWIGVTDRTYPVRNLCSFCHWFMLGPLYLTLYFKQNLKISIKPIVLLTPLVDTCKSISVKVSVNRSKLLLTTFCVLIAFT